MIYIILLLFLVAIGLFVYDCPNNDDDGDRFNDDWWEDE